MFRSSLIVAGAALLCSSALAQHQIDPARRLPITGPVKNAGTLDVATGTWTRPGQIVNTKAVKTIFNNTCTWTTASYYAGFGECEDSYDEGRIPSANNSFGNPVGLTGAAKQQKLTSMQIFYCTYNDPGPVGPGAGPGLNMELAVWNNLNGNCIGATPLGHGQWQNPAVTDYYLNLAGAGLPGSQAAGTQACWVVTLDTSGDNFTMLSDGDGNFDNLQSIDKFTWGKRINDKTPGGGANGFVMSGEPSKGVAAVGGGTTGGSCSYNIPCATDPFSPFGAGGPCGHGLGAYDNSWINVDNVAPGSPNLPPAPCSPGVAVYGYGTNCYFFGGYPTNVFDSYWLVMEGDDTGGGAASFCTSKPSSLPGCTPTFSIPVTAVTKGGTQTINATAGPAPGFGNKPGILIFSKVGTTPGTNTQFGWLCLQSFLRAGAFPTLPGGTSGQCNGLYTWNLQTIVNGLPQLAAGNTTWWQAWYRDPTNPPGGANFTNGQGPVAIQ